MNPSPPAPATPDADALRIRKALGGLPLVGLLPRIRKDPLGFLMEASRHGDVVPLDLGIRKAYLVNHPEHLKRVLQDNRANYPKSVLYQKLKPVFGNGLLIAEGEVWSTHRRMIQPAFSHSRLDGMARVMVEETLARLPRIAASAGKPIDMADELSALTLAIVVKTMFGSEIRDDMAGIADAVEVLNEHGNHRINTLIDVPKWIPTPRNRRSIAARVHIENIVYRIIRERRAAESVPGGAAAASPKSGRPDRGPRAQDLLDMLLEARYDDGSPLDEVQLRDEVMTIFFAGHETTATSLSWTLHLLDRNPEAQAALRRELSALDDRPPSFADVHRMPYLKMVVEEGMRLRPPVWSFSRTALAADRLGATDIPKGSLLLLSPWVTHRDPRWWDDPEAFRPERFAPDLVEKRPRYAWFPFGGGPRMCIGNGFAMAEGQLVLACLLRKLRFETAGGPAGGPGGVVTPQPLVTLRPKGGMWMIPRPAEAPVLTA